MWLFRGLFIGFYHPFFLIFHVPLWCTGYLIRDKAKSPTARRIWMAVFAAAVLFGELSLHFWITGDARWTPMILLTLLLDLMIGYFSKAGFRIIGGAFKTLIDWINKNEE